MTRPTFDEGFSTSRLGDVYSPDATVAALLQFEKALARVLAEVGIAPVEEIEALVTACERSVPDPASILASTWERGTPILALREWATAGLPSEVGRWFHYGATSQDAIDTAQMLQARDALETLDDLVVSAAKLLRDLTDRHRDLPHMGRTFLQDARAMTFGFRTATWLDGLLTHIAGLRDLRSHLPVQLGGPVGTRETFGDMGERVAASVADRLGLVVPSISWHSNRSFIVNLAQTVERLALTMAKIAGDIAWLASSAVGEIRVRSGTSSSMPEKMNPMDSVRAIASARACSGAVTMLTSASPHELDRGIGAWHVEWLALPLVFQTAGAAAESVGMSLDSLSVEAEVMAGHAGHPPNEEGYRSQIDAVLAAFDDLLG